MELKPDHTSYTVNDMDVTLPFYRDMFGMEVLRTNDRKPTSDTGLARMHIKTAVLRLGSLILELVDYVNLKGQHLDNRQTNIGSAHIGFVTDDVRSVYQRLVDRGVEITGPPISLGEGHPMMCYGVDPDGHRFELNQRSVLPAD